MMLLFLLACRRDAPPVWEVGDFLVSLSAPLETYLEDEGATLTVSHSAEPDRALWATLPGEGFVAAARGSLDVESGSGSYVFTDTEDERCSAQTLTRATDGDGLVIRGAITDCDLAYTLRFDALSELRLGFSVTLDDPDGADRVIWTGARGSTERLMGFGAQYSAVDMAGRRLPIWCQEQGIGRGDDLLTPLLSGQEGDPSGDWHTTYTCAPAMVTDAARGLLIEGDAYTTFDAEDAGRLSVTAYTPSLSGQILYGVNTPDVVTALTEATGRMAPLPDWTQTGAIVRAGGGSDAVRARLQALLDAGVPVAGLWIEDWCGVRETALGDRLWWNWEPDPGLYPDWAALVAEIKAAGVEVLIYFNPYLADAADKTDAVHNRYQEALTAGYLVSGADGAPAALDQGGFEAGLLDLSDPEAVAWLQALQAEQVDLGVSGWMADFGEALPLDAALADGSDPWQSHNAWPRRWAEVQADLSAQLGVDLLTWNRSGDAQSPGAARLFWLGDQTVTWDEHDGLQTVVPALLSSGLSGYSLQHVDAGGYLSVSAVGVVRTRELWKRWVELAACTGLLRTHDTNQPDENIQVDTDADTLAFFARFANLYAALAEVRGDAMTEAQGSGLPLIRPVAWADLSDPDAYEITQEFLLGSDVLVAPVVEEGVTDLEVWLPAGPWVHLWSGEVLGEADRGEWVHVDAPLGEPPIFYLQDSRAGANLESALIARGVLSR